MLSDPALQMEKLRPRAGHWCLPASQSETGSLAWRTSCPFSLFSHSSYSWLSQAQQASLITCRGHTANFILQRRKVKLQVFQTMTKYLEGWRRSLTGTACSVNSCVTNVIRRLGAEEKARPRFLEIQSRKAQVCVCVHGYVYV